MEPPRKRHALHVFANLLQAELRLDIRIHLGEQGLGAPCEFTARHLGQNLCDPSLLALDNQPKHENWEKLTRYTRAPSSESARR